jgi:type II secretion system protein J
MEVLIAIAVCAIILAAINTAFYSAVRLRNRTLAALDEATPVELALAKIRHDLANIVAPNPTNGAFGGSLSSTVTQTQFGQISPDFYTATAQIDGLVPFGDVQKIGYGLMPGANGDRELVRLVSRNLLGTTPETPTPEWLLSGVRSISFHYFDGTQWAEAWDTTTQSNLPAAIKVDLELTNTLMHMVVALDTQVRTNR